MWVSPNGDTKSDVGQQVWVLVDAVDCRDGNLCSLDSILLPVRSTIFQYLKVIDHIGYHIVRWIVSLLFDPIVLRKWSWPLFRCTSTMYINSYKMHVNCEIIHTLFHPPFAFLLLGEYCFRLYISYCWFIFGVMIYDLWKLSLEGNAFTMECFGFMIYPPWWHFSRQ